MFIKDYESILYHYQEARIVEEGEFGRLQFGYSIIHPGNHTITELHEDENFVTFMGELLQQILEMKTNEPIRTDYNQEPDLQ